MNKKTQPRKYRTEAVAAPREAAHGQDQFSSLVPNTETVAAIKQARRGGLESYRTTKALLKSLNTSD